MSYQEFLKRTLTLLALVLLLVGGWYLRSIWIWGFMAAVIAVGFSIPARWLQQRGLKPILADFISIIGVGSFLVLLVVWMIPTLINETGTLMAQIPTAISTVAEQYQGWRLNSSDRLQEFLPSLEALASASENDTAQITDLFNTESLLPVMQGVSTVFGTLFDIAIMLLIAVFFLIDPGSYVEGSLMLLPRKHHARARAVWQELYRTLKSYIASVAISITIIVSLVWFVLGVLLNVPNALVIAAFAGVATFIPNIGAVIPLIPITVFTLADNPALTIPALATYLVIQMAESNVLTPMIVKNELNIPAGLLMLFQLVATLMFGALGLLLAVPMLAVIMALVRELYSYDVLGLNENEAVVSAEPITSPKSIVKPKPMPTPKKAPVRSTPPQPKPAPAVVKPAEQKSKK